MSTVTTLSKTANSQITRPQITKPKPHQALWPLPALNGQKPALLVKDYFDPGIELAYEQVHEPGGPIVRLAGRERDDAFFLPAFTPVFAVFDGTIVYAGKHANGYTIIVHHHNGWLTYYGRMEHMLALATDHRRVSAAARVRAGSVIGYAGSLNPAPLRALRFELWRLDDDCGCIAIDPIRFMRRWCVLPWEDERLKPATQPERDAA
jgi:hypothetical protein